MENQQKSTSKITLHYGIILGVVSILLSVILYALGMHYDQDWKQATFGFLIMATVIYLAIKKYKDFNDGYLTIGEAIKTGIGVAVVGSIISVVYSLIFMNFIEPDFIANVMEKAEVQMIEQNPNLTDDQVEQGLAFVEKLTSPLVISAISIMGGLFYGLIISLIIGLVLKKNKEEQY